MQRNLSILELAKTNFVQFVQFVQEIDSEDAYLYEVRTVRKLLCVILTTIFSFVIKMVCSNYS